MRLSHAICALFGLIGMQQYAQCPTAADVPFSHEPVAGLTLADLEFPPQSNGRGWASHRVQTSPGYWVRASIDITSHGNGLLYVEDDRGACLRTRIYDKHAEDETWLEIEGGLFSYQFADDDGDGELELQVWGAVEVWDDAGLIDTYEHRERWDRSLAGMRPWYLAGAFDTPHETSRETSKTTETQFQEQLHDLGCDSTGGSWQVRTRREGCSWEYECEIRRDGTRVRELSVTSRYDPNFTLKSAAGLDFLVVTEEGMHGTGISSTWEEWYFLGAENVRSVRSFYSSGYVYGWGQPYDREISVSAELIETPSLRLVLTLNLDCSADGYLGDGEEFAPAPTNDGNGGHMFSATATAAFEWDATACKFVVLNKERADAVDDAMMGASDYLVEHFSPELQKYVEEYRGQCGPWLKWLRSKCDIEANRLLIDSLIAMDS